MTAHTDTPVAAVLHSSTADPRMELASAMKFEPSEVQDFDLADKAAGQMMGKLLGFLFCVLVFLMTGVNIWMLNHTSTIKDTDPQAFLSQSADEAAASGHH